jgi:RNA-directed DNA polymerase
VHGRGQPKGMSRVREPKLKGKSYDIPKRLLWDAWLKVKDNGGAAGADGVTIEQFEQDLSGNLYRLWNRMSSGSYFPGPVRAVEIPKKGKKGETRVLGIPNVVDRVAQAAAALALEPGVEPVFHEDSYGYRPGRAPGHAVAVCRERCFKNDWVVDLDIRAFFGSLSHERLIDLVADRVADGKVLSLIRSMLTAGVLVDGVYEWENYTSCTSGGGECGGGNMLVPTPGAINHCALCIWRDVGPQQIDGVSEEDYVCTYGGH